MMMAGVLISAPFGRIRAPATATAAVGGAIPVAAGRAPRLCHNRGSELDAGDQLNLGMSRAFLYAGADSVLISLWNVNDASTAELMKLVYRKLTGGFGATRHCERPNCS